MPCVVLVTYWAGCLCCCTAGVTGLSVWCGISPIRLAKCFLGSADADLSVTGQLLAPAEPCLEVTTILSECKPIIKIEEAFEIPKQLPVTLYDTDDPFPPK